MTEYIKLCLVKRNISARQLAKKIDPESQTAAQNLSNKMNRNNFKVSDLEDIAKALDANLEIKFIDKETNKPII